MLFSAPSLIIIALVALVDQANSLEPIPLSIQPRNILESFSDHNMAVVKSRTAMASLSDDLLAVITALPPPNLILEPRDSAASYEASIKSNSEKINTLEKNASGASAAIRISAACQAAKLLFGVRVSTPGSPTYTEETQDNWSQACWLPAACFIKLQSTLEVALTMKIVASLQTTFAIRSGGHNPSPGFSSIGGTGILLDLDGLNQTKLSADKKIAHVEPGTTWDKVYTELEKSKLTVAGGRVSGVGVGGLITGGGMSHFSNHWGMVCDNVKNFEVVLASSAVVNANAGENSDLFKALKGGSANFGIVTRFDLYTYPDFQVWYTFKVYAAADRDAVMKAAVEVQKSMEINDKIGFFLSVSDQAFTAGMVYRGHTTLPNEFKVFDSITPLLIAVPETNGTALSVAIAASDPSLAKREIGTATIKMDATLYGQCHQILQDVITSTTFQLAFTFQPLSKPAVDKGKSKGGNSLNIQPVNQSILGFIAQWTADTDDATAKSQIRDLIAKVKAAAKARGLLLDFDFMNDSSYSQSPLKGYGTASLASLNAASTKYDPKKVFQKLQNSGFLLSKV